MASLDLRSSELEHQFIQDRINYFENNAAELCIQFSKYTKRIGQLRDTGDELAECILKLASKETLNHSLRSVLNKLSDIFVAVEDYRDAKVQRLDHKVILQLSSYGQICKNAREDLKKCFGLRTKELHKKQQLDKLRGKKPTNWQQINQAEHEAEKARNEVTNATINLAKNIDNFERRKLENLKKILLEFVNIELIFHCKAVELYTNAYGAIKDIKIEEDLQEFRNHFKPSCTIGEVALPPMTIIENVPITEPHKADESCECRYQEFCNHIKPSCSIGEVTLPPMTIVENVPVSEPHKTAELSTIKEMQKINNLTLNSESSFTISSESSVNDIPKMKDWKH